MNDDMTIEQMMKRMEELLQLIPVGSGKPSTPETEEFDRLEAEISRRLSDERSS